MTRLWFCTVGVSLLFAAVGCVGQKPMPEQAPDMRSFVAVAGLYSVWAADTPGPAPTPAGKCVEGCKCNGTGKERSGDGIAVIACRCPESCSCKKKGEAPCPTGNCPPKSTAR